MQMLARATKPAFSDRAAFVLNANARAVNDRLVRRMANVVPAGDLFLSRSIEDAERIAKLVIQRGYGQVFTGGGDGTLMSTINFLEQASAAAGASMPEVGVLKLGTGNAVAGLMGAKNPVRDADHIVRHGPSRTREVNLLRTDDGILTPFAGVGYDGAVLNDYIAQKNAAQGRLAQWLATSVFGYLVAMLFRSVPRHLGQPAPRVRITSKHDAFRMVRQGGEDVEVRIPAGEVLFEGPSPAVCVGSVPYFGFRFKMFPFAERKPGYMQLRVVTLSIPRILGNLFFGVWQGTYRHPDLRDFIVRDVEVTSDSLLDYQVGGDAAGERHAVGFTLEEEPVRMVELGTRLPPDPRELLNPARFLPARS